STAQNRSRANAARNRPRRGVGKPTWPRRIGIDQSQGNRGAKLESVLDPLENHGREGGDLRAYKWTGEGDGKQDGDDLRHEGERDLLHLRQRLHKGDADAHDHSHDHRRAGGKQDGPDGVLDDVECVSLVHDPPAVQRTTTPGPTITSSPLSSVATTPSL